MITVKFPPLFKEWYQNLTTKVKWEGQISRGFEEKQGVRQGGVWSPTAYKVFINSLLKIYEENKIGCHIGSIFCGVPTVADDVTLIANDPHDLQTMLSIQMDHAINTSQQIKNNMINLFFLIRSKQIYRDFILLKIIYSYRIHITITSVYELAS
jgi:hypothetical protein